MTAEPLRTGVAAAARCLALDLHAVAVVAALEGAGVPALLLKGPGLARRLYADDPARRRYSDVDVLVAPTDFDRAQQVLARTGHHDVAAEFPDDEWLWHERSWVLDGPVPLTVDLHRSFAGVGDAAALWDLVAPAAEELPLSGGTVRVPDVVGCALLVALHAAAPGRGRKAMTDLAQALDQLPEPVWEDAARWATAAEAEPAFVAGLQRLPAGAALAARLALGRPRSPWTRLLVALDLVLLRRSVEAVRGVPGWGAKGRYVARRLVPTPEFLRRATPLARRGPAGLVTAYLLRPLRLLLPAPVGTGPRPASRLRQWRWEKIRAAGWTVRALHQVRRDLAAGPLDQVRPAAAPPGSPDAGAAVRRMLRRRGASCLERSLVLQRWEAAQGVPVDLVVGVTAPGSGFRAHAWLATDGEAEHSHATMTEMLRRPTPPEWLVTRPGGRGLTRS